jgi:hypothetical protein
LSRRTRSRGRTEDRTASAFGASLAHLARATMRFPRGCDVSNGPGRSRTSAHGFEVRPDELKLAAHGRKKLQTTQFAVATNCSDSRPTETKVYAHAHVYPNEATAQHAG